MNSVEFDSQNKDSNKHEIKTLVDYRVKNPSFEDRTINGIMNVYTPDRKFITSYSYPDGFTVSESGIIEFSTSLNSDIEEISLSIYLTDLTKTKALSNEITTEVED